MGGPTKLHEQADMAHRDRSAQLDQGPLGADATSTVQAETGIGPPQGVGQS